MAPGSTPKPIRPNPSRPCPTLQNCQAKAGTRRRQALEARRRVYRDSKRLAYVSEAPVWWCEQFGTVLANEEVIDGKSEVGDFPVVRKPMRQWMLRITAYAERLLADLETIDWSESLKEMQRNWIGRSEGAEVDFRSRIPRRFGSSRPVRTLCSVRPTWCFPRNTSSCQRSPPGQAEAVEQYKAFAAKRSDLERTELARKKPGCSRGIRDQIPSTGQDPHLDRGLRLISYGTAPSWRCRDTIRAILNCPQVRPAHPAGRSTPAGADWQGFVDDGTPSIRPATRFPSMACRRQRPNRKSRPGLSPKSWAEKRSTTNCATGSSAGSVTGASLSRSSGN